MRIAFVWDKLDDLEFERTRTVMEAAFHAQDVFKEFRNLRISWQSDAGPSNKALAAQPYESEEQRVAYALKACFDFGNAQGLDYVVFSNGPAWVLDASRFGALLSRAEVKNASLSLRVAAIQGTGMQLSPKLPYIDDRLIIVNIAQCAMRRVFENSMIERTASHFFSWGGAHAALLGYLEAMCEYQSLYVYSDGQDLRNEFGDKKGFGLGRYHYSVEHRLLTYDLPLSTKERALQARTLEVLGLVKNADLQDFVQELGSSARLEIDSSKSTVFLKKAKLVRLSGSCWSWLKRTFVSMNFEFKKDYGIDKT